jgi:hypothetical protein
MEITESRITEAVERFKGNHSGWVFGERELVIDEEFMEIGIWIKATNPGGIYQEDYLVETIQFLEY